MTKRTSRKLPHAVLADSNLGYSVDHSAATYLVNPDGELQLIFPYMTPPEILAEAVEYVLSSGAD